MGEFPQADTTATTIGNEFPGRGWPHRFGRYGFQPPPPCLCWGQQPGV